MSKLSSKEIIDSIKQYSMLEINDLVKDIEKEFNISAAFVAASGDSANEDSKKDSTPSEQDLHLVNAGTNKIAVIKIIRELTELGLMDAKKLVDTVPSLIKPGVASSQFEDLKKKFADAGATIEFK